MTRSFRLARHLLAVSALVVLTLPATVRAQALPTPAEVLARHIEAVGGKAALEKITSIKQEASMQIPALGMEATMEVVMAAPNKMATKVTLPGIGETMQGTDGTVAWDVNPMAGPRLLADKELAQLKQTADFRGNLARGIDLYSSAENLGAVDFAGEKAWKLRLVLKEVGTETFGYYSVATGLSIGMETTQESPMGPLKATITTSGYKDFGGFRMPTRTEMVMGPQTIVTVVKTMEFNSVPDSAFEIPAVVKPLIKK